MNNKIKYIIAIMIIILGIIVYTINSQKDIIYNPQIINNIEDYKIEETSRYIILYDTQDKKYYLTKIESYGLNEKLLTLGKKPINFKDNKDGLLTLIASKYHITFYKTGYQKQVDKHNDITQIGLIEKSCDFKNKTIQLLHNKRLAFCHIPFEHYDKYIAIDLIESNK